MYTTENIEQLLQSSSRRVRSIAETGRVLSGEGFNVFLLSTLPGRRAMRLFTSSREGLFDSTESSLLSGSDRSGVRTFMRRRAGETRPTGLTCPRRGSSSDEGSFGGSFDGVACMMESSVGE